MFQVSATVAKHININSTIKNVEALPKKRYQDPSYSADSTSILRRTWNPSTIQIMNGLMPFDIVKKHPNIGRTCPDNNMSVKQRSINHASKDNQDAQGSTSEDLMGSTLRLQHTPSYNINETVSVFFSGIVNIEISVVNN